MSTITEKTALMGLSAIVADLVSDDPNRMQIRDQLISSITHDGPEKTWLDVVADPPSYGVASYGLPNLDDLADADSNGPARFITNTDPHWPSQLSRIEDEVLGLWVIGETEILPRLIQVGVSITGSRASSSYGETVASAMAGDLVDLGHWIVAGASYGIEAAAHRAAMTGLTPVAQTVVVLCHGTGLYHPAAHRGLMQSIAERGGALVSEYAPGTPPVRTRFIARGRIMARLTPATVIVEASNNGTAAKLARTDVFTHGSRTLCAVPGPVTSMASSATNRMLKDHAAHLVTNAEDVHDLIVGD